MGLAAVVLALLVTVAATCIPLVLFREGRFATDDRLTMQLQEERRRAARAAKGDEAVVAMRLQDCAEIRAQRRLRQFAFVLTDLPGLLVVGAITAALLTGLIVARAG